LPVDSNEKSDNRLSRSFSESFRRVSDFYSVSIFGKYSRHNSDSAISLTNLFRSRKVNTQRKKETSPSWRSDPRLKLDCPHR